MDRSHQFDISTALYYWEMHGYERIKESNKFQNPDKQGEIEPLKMRVKERTEYAEVDGLIVLLLAIKNGVRFQGT